MASKIDGLKEKLKQLPKEKEINVIYKTDTIKQVMDLLKKELNLLK